MRSQRLSLDSNSLSVEALEHRTFENYLASFTERAENETPVNKLRLLTNSVVYDLYDFIDECVTYEGASRASENLYVEILNKIFAGHLLATASQVPRQSLNDFVQRLQDLGKDCNFRPVTAQVYPEEMIRDAFINRIMSSSIQQRLLENRELTLRDAITQANTVELAQQNSQTYDASDNLTRGVATVTEKVQLVSQSQLEEEPRLTSVRPRKIKGKRCFFYGTSVHDRMSCPVRSAVYYNCMKKGHFVRVCENKQCH